MEIEKGKPQLAHLEKTLEYAEKHNKKYRLHTVVWDFEAAEPQWLMDLKKSAHQDPVAREEYKREVERRIDYLVAPHSDQYIHIDTINESYHHPFDWKEMGWDWFAHITKTIQKKAPNALLYVNEYGVISDCEAPDREDIYGNWYLDHILDIVRAGGVVEGIGVQAHYVHNYYRPLEDFYTLHNLANSLLPITITEFSTDESDMTPQIVEESLRLAYGNPQVNGFVFFGFAENMIFRPGSELVDSNWELTDAGKAFVNLMKRWKTDTEARVRKDGTVEFVGYYGDYELTDGKNTWKFTHKKGQDSKVAELIVSHR